MADARPAGVEPLLQKFAYSHLRPDLQAISVQFFIPAMQACITYPPSPDRTAYLRDLERAKNAAVQLAVEPNPALHRIWSQAELDVLKQHVLLTDHASTYTPVRP